MEVKTKEQADTAKELTGLLAQVERHFTFCPLFKSLDYVDGTVRLAGVVWLRDPGPVNNVVRRRGHAGTVHQCTM